MLRAWQSDNTFNSVTNDNLRNAVQGGLNSSQVMLYMIPCGGDSGKNQVQNLMKSIDQSLINSFNKIWINVETNPVDKCKFGDKNAVCTLITDMINEIRVQGKVPGIYSNIYMWQHYLQDQCAGLDQNIPTWYPHDDKLPNFYDFSQFGAYGGW